MTGFNSEYNRSSCTFVRRTSTNRSSKSRKGFSMMCNPYKCETQLDELNPDDSVIDYSFISEENFLLVILLISNGDVQAYYEVGSEKSQQSTVNIRSICGRVVDPVTVSLSPDASFMVVGLLDGNILLVPTKCVLSVSWSAGSPTSITNSPSIITVETCHLEPLMVIPTSIRCFKTKFPERATVVTTNKGGSIFLIDIELRKCIAELTAPQSIHSVEVISDSETTDLLLTGFTGAQWIIPLENRGRGFAEVLSTCIPSEFKQVEPKETQLSIDHNGVCALNSTLDALEVHKSVHTVGGIPKKKYKVPPETWLTHSTDNVIFCVSRQTDLRCAIHFGLSSVRLEYVVMRGFPEWRILAFVPLFGKTQQLPSCLVINERGLVRISQNDESSIDAIAAEFLFRLPVFSLITVSQVADATRIEAKHLKDRLIPSLLKTKKEKKFSAVDLARILTMAKAIELSMEKLLELFSETGREDNLLPELLRVVESDKKSALKSEIVRLYAKKCENVTGCEDLTAYRHKKDSELSVFLSRHSDVTTGVDVALSVPFWKSSGILASRTEQGPATVFSYLVEKGEQLWKDSDNITRNTMLSCVCQLDWSALCPKLVHRLVLLLCGWQHDFTAPIYHEKCLRLAVSNEKKFGDSSKLLYLVSVIYLLGERDANRACTSSCQYRSISCGLNSTAVVSVDDRLVVWGDMENKPVKRFEASEIPLKSARRVSSTDSPATSPIHRRSKLAELPHAVQLDGRPHALGSGAEHMVVLSSSGQLFSWGNNRFGQCGVGHSHPVLEPQMLEGKWPDIVQLSVGQFHSAILCVDGSVWTWGWSLYGQLGHGTKTTDNFHVPTRVSKLEEKVVSVRCGRVHTLLLTSNGHIYMAGGGAYGQTGSNDDVKKVPSFTRLLIGGDDSLKFRKIATHFYHSVAVSECDRIFEWGRNPQELKMRMFVMRRVRNAQKSAESPNAVPTAATALPMEVPRDDLGWREVGHLLDGKVEEIATGLSHSAVITEHGTLFTWGKSLEYQLGHGNKTERSEPHQLFEPANVKWKHVACGGNNSVAVSTDGRVFGWGRNDFTQCGMPSDKGVSTPKKYFYQGKEGAKRCVQLPDDSVFVIRPTLVADIEAKLPRPGDAASSIDEEDLLSRIRSADITTIQAISRHFTSPSSLAPPLSYSVPLALCHLMAGNMTVAIDQIGRCVAQYGESNLSVVAVSSIAWEVLANFEETQRTSLLQKAFSLLPMTKTQKNSSQLKNLWPNVWEEPKSQERLTSIDKLDILESWKPAVRPANSIEVPGSSLRGGVARVRVWAQCGHVEHASVGVATECSTCADEWRDRVKSTLGVG